MVKEAGEYTEGIHNLSAGQVWAAWKNQKLTVCQVATWQQRHNYYFKEEKQNEQL